MDTPHNNQEIIDQQSTLLVTHRKRLATRLIQQATHGVSWGPPEIRFDIDAARADIQRIKHVLATLGVVVANEPDDEAPEHAPAEAIDHAIGTSQPLIEQDPAGFVSAHARPAPAHQRPDDTFTYDAYISYAKDTPDRIWVWDTLIPRLRKAGVRIVVDDAPSLAGVDRVSGSEQAIEQAKRTVLILSDAYLIDTWRRFERVMADHLGITEGSYRLLPVLIAPLKQQRAPLHLQRLIWIDLSQSQYIEQGFKTLIAALLRPLPHISA